MASNNSDPLYYQVRCTQDVPHHGTFKRGQCFAAYNLKPGDADSAVWVGIQGLPGKSSTFSAMDFSLHFCGLAME